MPNRMMNLQRVGLLSVVLLLSSCNIPGAANQATLVPTQAVPTVEPSSPPLVMNTVTPEVVQTSAPAETVATVTTAPQTSAESASALEGETTVLSINMRSGPSTAFDVAGTYNIGTMVTVIGQTPDKSWYYVQPRDNNFGWMFADYLKLDSETIEIPVIVPTPATVFKGQVINTTNQTGVDLVDIAVVQGTGAEVLRAETYSQEDGSFEVYLPANASGTWRIVIVGVGCESNIMLDGCAHSGGFTPDLGITFTLPEVPVLEFRYTP